jgi:hypothetical protein
MAAVRRLDSQILTQNEENNKIHVRNPGAPFCQQIKPVGRQLVAKGFQIEQIDRFKQL